MKVARLQYFRWVTRGQSNLAELFDLRFRLGQ